MNPTPKTKYDLFILDAFRGLAAFMVMAGHARWLLWEGYSEGYQQHPELYNSFEKALVYLLSVFRFGHEAVLFFFVLSGFVIHLRYSKNLVKDENASFDLFPFLVRRIRRIYPPFLFVLLFTFVLDRVGANMGWSIYAHQTPNELLNNNVQIDHSWINLLGNLVFWQNEQVTVWGSNGPLWSLKYEWWFYMGYPLLYLVTRRSAYGALLLVIALFAGAWYLSTQSHFFLILVLIYLLSWWMGTVLADIYSGRLKWKFSWLSPLVLLIPVMLVKGTLIGTESIRDVVWGLGFTGLIATCFWLQEKGIYFRFMKKIKWLGDCSYTLYIIHFPLFVFLNGFLLSRNNNQMPRTQLYIIAGIGIALLLSYLLHFVIERPFIQAKKKEPAPVPVTTG